MVYLRACLAFAVGNEPTALQLAPVWLARQRAFDSLAALAYFLTAVFTVDFDRPVFRAS